MFHNFNYCAGGLVGTMSGAGVGSAANPYGFTGTTATDGANKVTTITAGSGNVSWA